MRYAVVVTFQIDPAQFDAFMPLMMANAQTSQADEPGCHQFDVATDPARPNEVFLYEIYDNLAAFNAHLASAHFKAFDAAISAMVQGKTVTTYSQVAQ